METIFDIILEKAKGLEVNPEEKDEDNDTDYTDDIEVEDDEIETNEDDSPETSDSEDEPSDNVDSSNDYTSEDNENSNDDNSNENSNDEQNVNDMDSEDEDDSTDYTDDIDSDSETGDVSDNGDSSEDNGDGESDTGMGNDESDDMNPEQENNEDDKKKSFALMRDYVSLYDLMENGIEQLSRIDTSDLNQKKIISQVKENLGKLQDLIHKYILFDYKKNDYIQNLTVYNYFINAIKINIEILKKRRDVDVNYQT